MTWLPLTRNDGRAWRGTGQLRPHAVYRMYAGDGRLLYVGCTADVPTRLRSHTDKPWIRQVARIELEWHPDFASARAAERRAIAREDPPHNIGGRIPRPRELTAQDSARIARAAIRELPFAKLTADQQMEDRVFIAIVRALTP